MPQKSERVQVAPVRQVQKKKKPSASVQKMLTKPLEYADGAIAELSRQLEATKSSKRKLRLQNKITMWMDAKAALLKAIHDRLEKQAEIAAAAELDKKSLTETIVDTAKALDFPDETVEQLEELNDSNQSLTEE